MYLHECGADVWQSKKKLTITIVNYSMEMNTAWIQGWL